jgi:hypothetical protein
MAATHEPPFRSDSLILLDPTVPDVLRVVQPPDILFIASGKAGREIISPRWPKTVPAASLFVRARGTSTLFPLSGARSLARLERELPMYFRRINQGALVNLSVVRAFETSFGRLDRVGLAADPNGDCEWVSVSERGAVALKRLFPHYPRIRPREIRPIGGWERSPTRIDSGRP